MYWAKLIQKWNTFCWKHQSQSKQGWTLFPKNHYSSVTFFKNLLFFQWNFIYHIKNRLINFNPYSLKDHMHTTVDLIAFVSNTLVKILKILFSNEEFVHRASLFIDYSSRMVSNPLFFHPPCGPLSEEGSSICYWKVWAILTL